MKKATLDATDENILQSIADQIGNRNARILEFIKILDAIEDNRFISLDARWGEGKTFYVRQIEKTLEYQTLKKFGTDDTKIWRIHIFRCIIMRGCMIIMLIH